MKPLKIINFFLAGVVLLGLSPTVISLVHKTELPEKTPAPAPAPTTEQESDQSEETGIKIIPSFHSDPVSPEELAGIFHRPESLEPSPLIPAPSLPENNIKQETIYNRTRLSYLGFSTITSDSGKNKHYLIRDNLYRDVFGVSPGEKVYGFSITSVDEEKQTITLTDGEVFFMVVTEQ